MVSNRFLMCLFIKVFDPLNANFAICIPFFLVAKPNSTLTENPCELVGHSRSTQWIFLCPFCVERVALEDDNR